MVDGPLPTESFHKKMNRLRLVIALSVLVALGLGFLVFGKGEKPEAPREAAAQASLRATQGNGLPSEADSPLAPTPIKSVEEPSAPVPERSIGAEKLSEASGLMIQPDTLAKVKAVIKNQNDYRQKLGLHVLAVSPALQEEAEALVEKNIAMTCAPNVARKIVAGQSAAYFWEPALPRYSGPPSAQDLEPRYVVEVWKSGRQELGVDGVSCDGNSDCENYLQMTRATARKVGCAMAICPSQAQIWICRYGE